MKSVNCQEAKLLPSLPEYTSSYYDDDSIHNFQFKGLSDANSTFEISCTGHLYKDTATITDVDFYITDSIYDFVPITSLRVIALLIEKLDAAQTLNNAMFAKYGHTFERLHLHGVKNANKK